MGLTIKGGDNFEYGKENLEQEIHYHKFAISHEETGLRLTFSFPFFSITALQSFYTNKMLTRKKNTKTGRNQNSSLLLLVNSEAKTTEN